MTEKTIDYSDIMEIEDFLQGKCVFISGIDGRNQHMDSYMTIIDYDKLKKNLNEIKNNYTINQWKQISNHWNEHAYLSPNQAQLSSFVNHYIIN